MALSNPFSITYGSRQVGGSTSYQIDGPYAIDKSQESFRLAFDVIVVATSYATLQTLSDALEDDFRLRDQNVTISLDGNDWVYVRGENILSTSASIAKSGDPDTDKGYSRRYTCTIEGELPSDGTDDGGLRDIEVLVDYEPGRQRVVTMRGTYTAYGSSGSGSSAYALYAANAATEASTYLTFIDNTATWELVDENYTLDRNRIGGGVTTPSPHVLNFTRQYVELLANQTQGTLDATNIKDHRIQFTDTSQHPGDSAEGIYRLRRVLGSYSCSVDIEQTTDLSSVYENQIKPYLKALFLAEFTPSAFCFESRNVSYEETLKRISVEFQFLYQKSGGSGLVEMQMSLAYRETRNIDYTPVHDGDEFTAVVDPGWSVLERIWNLTAIYLGSVNPIRRISKGQDISDSGAQNMEFATAIGQSFRVGSASVEDEGWNIISNLSSASPQWIGDPDEEQIQVTVLTEQVVERWTKKPAVKTGGGSTR